MAKLNRQQRRTLKKKSEDQRKLRQKFRKQENEIQELRQQIIAGFEALVRKTLEQEFGFGKKRMQRFVDAFDSLAKETSYGFKLVKGGVSLQEFRDHNEVRKHVSTAGVQS